jgi:hypothetical protein
MPSIPILLATLGLALNVLLWSVPGLVAASAAVPFSLRSPGPRPSIPDALVNLLSAELEAVQVAGVAIENPSTPRLGERADQAGGRVHDAVRRYVAAVQATISR